MNVVKTVLLASATLCIIGQTAYAANDCSREERSVRVTKSRLLEAQEEIKPIERRLRRVEKDARDIRSKYSSAVSANLSAERDLRELRDTNYNSEEYISNNERKIREYKKILVKQKAKAEAQKRKYRKLSKWNPKRIFEKAEFKKLEKKYKETESSIRSHEYKIIKITDIVNDFDFLEDDAIARVDYTERQIADAEADLPEADRLDRRATRLKRELREEKEDLHRLAKRVDHAKEKLQACLAE